MEDKYSFFAHRECEFFTCNPGADPDRFNCLFCYCPLYCLGKNCGGNFTVLETGSRIAAAVCFPISLKITRRSTAGIRRSWIL